MPLALVREVPASFVAALAPARRRPRLDVEVARRQHGAYLEVLRGAGYQVTALPADEAHPDCCFIEDTAVTLGRLAVATRPGAPSRRGEVAVVAAALGAHMPVAWISEPATLDGGDVLRVGGRLFVGRSRRSNEEGIRQLARLAARQGTKVWPVEVRRGLHLKSSVAALDEETILLAPRCLDETPFGGLRLLRVPAGEQRAANSLCLVDGTVLIPAGCPRTFEMLAASGFRPVAVDVSQFEAAAGGLSCLSLLLD